MNIYWRERVINKIASAIVVLAVFCLLFYPAFFCLKVAFDPALRRGEIPAFMFKDFKRVSGQYGKWAAGYLASRRATKVDPGHVAATEWPMFGSVYYLVTAEEILSQLGDRDDAEAVKMKHAIRKAAKAAADIVADPDTASWVKAKWGDSYLDKENCFYRMLLIMGLSSYERISADKTYHKLLSSQANSLADELAGAQYHMLNDYPGECYPNDVLWAVAAIIRADGLIGADHSKLKTDVLSVLNERSLSKEGIPAYSSMADTAEPCDDARGCSNSGILIFAPELDIGIAGNWYDAYDKYFWQDNGFCSGFREFPRDSKSRFSDADTGPVIAGYGTVASIFSIGPSRSLGRLDRSVPVTMEAIAISWPTPFGYVFPSLMAYFGTKAPPLGEVAMLFVMTRPILTEGVTPYSGKVPGIVWTAIGIYLSAGIILLVLEFRYWRRRYLKKNGNRKSKT